MRFFNFSYGSFDFEPPCPAVRVITVSETLASGFSSEMRPDPLDLNSEIQFVRSDLYFILNQDKLKNDESLVAYFRDKLENLYRSRGDVFDDQSLSDEDILRTVKSRYLQHSSEVEAWFDSMVDDLKSLTSVSSEKFRESIERVQSQSSSVDSGVSGDSGLNPPKNPTV